MMSHKDLEAILMELPHAWLDYPFGEGVAVYKVGGKESVASSDAKGVVNPNAGGRGKMFALISEGTQPLRISLKCDPLLAITLREKYETVLPGYHLSKKHWNTIICSGQVPDDELKDLIRHSYELVKD